MRQVDTDASAKSLNTHSRTKQAPYTTSRADEDGWWKFQNIGTIHIISLSRSSLSLSLSCPFSLSYVSPSVLRYLSLSISLLALLLSFSLYLSFLSLCFILSFSFSLSAHSILNACLSRKRFESITYLSFSSSCSIYLSTCLSINLSVYLLI